MSSHLKINFDKAEISNKAATDPNEFVRGIAALKDAGKPSFVYLFSKAVDKKKGKPTKAAQNCEEFAEKVLNGEEYKLMVAAKLFKCVSIDISALDAAENRVFNEANAPIVLLVGKDGAVAKTFTGKIRAADVYAAMMALIDKADAKKIIDQIDTLMKKELFKVELNIAKLKSELEKPVKSLTEAQQKNKTDNVKKLQEQIAAIQEKIKKEEEARSEVLKKEKELMDQLMG